jgi:glycosyltransferase involved in cell wall biosynthesis
VATILLCYRDHSDPRGGGAVHGYNVVQQLRRLGHRIITAEPDTDDRVEQHPRSILGMRALLRSADCIYMRCDARPWEQLLLAQNLGRKRIPVVVEVNALAEEAHSHGDGLRAQVRVASLRAQYRNILRQADAVVCVSKTLAEVVEASYRVPADRVHVIPNGATPAATPPEPRDDGRFKVVWAGGSRWPWQAIDTVVRAAALLEARVAEARVLLYTDGDLARFANRRGVVAHPQVPHADMGEVLRGMDAALCLYRPMPRVPTGFYNSPLKLFDAMGAGLPVVASSMGQIAEVVEDGVSGYLVDDDPGQVADRLVILARDPDKRRQMGRAALERITSAYTWDHAGDSIEAVLRSVLA